MGIRGLEHTALAHIETPISGSGGAECVAHSDDSRPLIHSDPALNELIRAWPTLSGWTRWQIQELIENQNPDTPTLPNTQTDKESAGDLD